MTTGRDSASCLSLFSLWVLRDLRRVQAGKMGRECVEVKSIVVIRQSLSNIDGFFQT